MFESHSTVFIYGWKFREPKLTHKHAQKIRDFFRPKREINSVIKSKVRRIRSDYDLLIGVHIRRGDYDKWKGGKYFYSQRDYLTYMLKISELHPSSNIVFLICSNEKVVSCIFESLSIKVMDASPIEDLYTLSECDLLIGPPSTFTQWASFYGKKPLSHIYSLSDCLTSEDFRVHDITEIPG
ncbi:MAG: alpha-1,2-fucosyltransferase [Opitutales bacterium]|nr:alpha-1,2-fucosyltransferase [Opitutales bacterium]